MSDEQAPKNKRSHPLEAPPGKRPHPLEAPPPPKPDDEPPRPRMILRIPPVKPVATQLLIAVNVAVYVIAMFLMSQMERYELYQWGASNRDDVLVNGEYHRLFTAMFLHAEIIMHILFNMYALYIIGQTVERFFGHVRFLLIYFLGGLSGSILSVMLNGPDVYSVGASGAVFAIFGAEMVFLYKHLQLFGKVAQIQLRQLVIFAGINLFIGIASAVSPQGVDIDNWGHIGGFLGGVVLAWIIGPVLVARSHPMMADMKDVEDTNPLPGNLFHVIAYAMGLVIAVWIAQSGV